MRISKVVLPLLFFSFSLPFSSLAVTEKEFNALKEKYRLLEQEKDRMESALQDKQSNIDFLLKEKEALLSGEAREGETVVDGVVFEKGIKITSGFRNCNPMSIAPVSSKDPWLGQVGVQKNGLAAFENFEYGLRAGFMTICSYQNRHKVKTLSQFGKRYCMGDPEGYAMKLAKALGVGVNQEINLTDYTVPLMKAIIVLENGSCPFPDKFFIPYMNRRY